MAETNLSISTEEQDEAGAAGSTDINGDLSVMDDPSLPDAFNFSILSSASSHVSRTS